MYKPPLFRRILPWLYAVLFLCIAPLLLLYTAGYRYNVKKASIERQSTLITDSTPDEALVFLDGISTDKTTPVTFQYLSPGWHTLRIEKSGYFPWVKTLELRPERVTFANRAHLWRREPLLSLASSSTVLALEPTPEQTALAVLFQQEDGLRSFAFLTPSGFSRSYTLPPRTLSEPQLSWNSDGTAVLLRFKEESYWIRPRGRDITVRPLPQATYHWQEETLYGYTTKERITVNGRNGDIEREPMENGRDESGRLTLLATSSSHQLLLDQAFRETAFALPPGAWTFGDMMDRYLITLKSETDASYLNLALGTERSSFTRIEGDRLRWFFKDGQPEKAITLSATEVWLTDGTNDPVLLRRQSDPFIEAAWHASGDSVFLATTKSLRVLELDDRSGRISEELATFDQINDISPLEQEVMVAGTKNGQTGLWRVVVD